MPFEATWFYYQNDDDIFNYDDDAISGYDTCVSESKEFPVLVDDTLSDDAASTFTAVYFFTTAATGPTNSPVAAPTLSPVSSKSSKSSCFAGSETMLLANNSVVPISEVKVGNLVLASDARGRTRFARVIAVPHARNFERATFLHISMASGMDIKLTPDHLIMVAPLCQGEYDLMAASAAKAGMCLLSTDGPVVIESVHVKEDYGVYTVVTEEEFVVVNSIIASPFAFNHAIANAYYNIFRLLPSLARSSAMKEANLVLGSLLETLSRY
jgi:hypothetical protein